MINIHFAQPLWLWAGLAACLGVIVFLRLSGRRRQDDLKHFAASHLLGRLTNNVSPARRVIKNTLVVLALACCFIALARPQYGSRWIEVQRRGIDILFAVDTSKSMMARDIKPDRLERAKLAIKDFVGRLGGDRVGLLPFAGSAFLMCPLTLDYAAFDFSLDALDTNIIPKGGTDLAAAIKAAESVLANETNHKILILVTDGENLQGDALAAAREAKKHKMIIYTVGVGTPKGELIPLPRQGKGKFLQDSSGRFVTSKLDETMLTKIAAATGGLYVPLGAVGQGLETIYQRKLALAPKEEHGQRLQKVPVERFMWPLAAAVLLLTFEFLLSGRKPAWSFHLPFIKTAGRRSRRNLTLFLVACLLAGMWPGRSLASPGEKHFAAGKFEKAEQYYRKALKDDPDNPVLNFNLGDAAYKDKRYDQAIAAFKRALRSDDLGLQAKSYYNLGNARFRLGQQTLKSDPEHALQMWQEALKSYESSLKLAPNDQDARYNRPLVKKRLEKLQKQLKKLQEQQKQRQKSSQGKGKQQQKQNKNKQTGRSQQQKRQGGRNRKNPDHKQKQNQAGPGRKKSGPAAQNHKNKENKGRAGNESATPKQQGAGKGAQAAGRKKGAKAASALPAVRKQQRRGRKGEAAAMSNKDKARRRQGQMTKQEAQDLLNSLKGNEGMLHFVPRQGSGNNNQPGRNW
ncbi:von Willebrand factor type A domain protein [bacterium BMS3Bbin14]|nr:von Willebrand factor type A domain protein [bacterium BMS3Bbin14]